MGARTHTHIARAKVGWSERGEQPKHRLAAISLHSVLGTKMQRLRLMLLQVSLHHWLTCFAGIIKETRGATPACTSRTQTDVTSAECWRRAHARADSPRRTSPSSSHTCHARLSSFFSLGTDSRPAGGGRCKGQRQYTLTYHVSPHTPPTPQNTLDKFGFLL